MVEFYTINSFYMEDYILISTLNDFIFCPYSIYLHNVYMGGDEGLVHAIPQTRGKAAHTATDGKSYSSRKGVVTGLSVYSNDLGIAGKIDIYKEDKGLLVERKFRLNTIYQGQKYQLWAQYFCMTEMGYRIDALAFHAISTNTTFPIDIPTWENKEELRNCIELFKKYDPNQPLETNPNKCTHCIYCNLCDKTETENVYS